ncbi:MAG: ribosome-associated translation inhibitor RaiA [Coriobacteriia bacterium]|nr:ribosome-associated translation inhibitor RaiA [Coriobacteriia bacterium]
MELTVSGRGFNVTDWMREYCDEKIGNAARVFNIDPLTIDIVLGLEKNPANPVPARCEVTLRAQGHVIHVEEFEEEIHAAIDVAAAKVTRQLRKYKTRVMDKKILTQEREAQRAVEGAGGELDIEALMDDLSEEDIVRTKEIELTPMTKDEAIIEFDLLGHDFYMFKDADTNKVCVLYQRVDGGYGLITEK